MKLWIDDLRTPPDSSWTWAKTLEEAMAHVTAVPHDVTEISFDHDLGVKYQDQDGWFRWRDTQPVAKWYEAEAKAGRLQQLPVWFIHSMNPPGRKELLAILQRAERYIIEGDPDGQV